MKAKTLGSILIFLWALVGYTQEYESFFEEFSVILHQLQINVLDKGGQPVQGLTKDDFEIFLNGKAQELETVEEIELASRFQTVTGNPIPQQARRLFALFFDLRYSTKRGVLDAQTASREFVMSEMLPSDLVGVFTYSQLAGVTMVTNFTSNPDHLLTAIDTLGLVSAKNVLPGPAGYYLESVIKDNIAIQGFDRNRLAGASRSTVSAGLTFSSEHVEEMMRLAQTAEKSNYEREVMGFLESMRKFADGLRFIRGRKNLIWFSSGFDATSLIGASSKEREKYSEYAMSGLYERIPPDQYGKGQVQSSARRAIDALQASGTVIFAIDTSKVQGLSAEKSGIQTLNYFSYDTGGRMFTNQNKYEGALGEIKDITNHYYLVGFYPDTGNKEDKVGRIKVRIKNNSKVKIYTNRGLLLDPDFEGMTKIEKDIHIAEYIARDQNVQGIPMSVGVIQIPMDDRFVKLSVGLDLRGDYFVAPGIKSAKREIEVFAMAFERDSNRVFDQNYFKFKINPQRLEDILGKTGVKYFANLFVEPGEYKIKVVARDLKNGKIGSQVQYLTVSEGGPAYSGPVLLTQDQWVMVRQPEELERLYRTDQLDLSYPFRLGDEQLVPNATPVVAPGKQARFFYILNHRGYVGKRVPSVQVMFMGEDKKYIMIPQDAVKAETELMYGESRLTHVVISVDLDKVALEEGETYKFMAYFDIEGSPPIRSMSDITVVSL